MAKTVLNRIYVLMALLAILPAISAVAENTGQPAEVMVNALNFRQKPSKRGTPITKLNKGDKVIVLASENGWLKIVHQGRIGFIKDNPGFVAFFSNNGADTQPLEGLIKKSQDLDARLEARQSSIKALTKKEKEIFDSLDTIESTLNQGRIKIRTIKQKMAGLNENIEITRASIRELEKKIKEHKDYADKRIVALYKINRLGGMAHVSPANENLFDLIKQKNSFERILQKDQERITQYTENIEKLNDLVETRKTQMRELAQLQSDLAAKQQAVTKKHDERSALLAEIQGQRQLELASRKMLAEAAKNLDEEIQAITKTVFQTSDSPKSGKDSFVRLKGLLNMPVKGKVISSFGTYKNPRNNITLYRNGIDIQADRGEPVRAVSAGKVLYAKWFKGYGNMIIIDHGDHYYSVYANIDELFKTTGDNVKKNEVIATVGDTGSLKGPKLYFEIRYYGKPQDPMHWIRTG